MNCSLGGGGMSNIWRPGGTDTDTWRPEAPSRPPRSLAVSGHQLIESTAHSLEAHSGSCRSIDQPVVISPDPQYNRDRYSQKLTQPSHWVFGLRDESLQWEKPSAIF